jgi:hypothetical protein
MKFFGTVTLFICFALALTILNARAQSSGGSALWGAGMTGGPSIPGPSMCGYTIAPAACAKRAVLPTRRVVRRKVRR